MPISFRNVLQRAHGLQLPPPPGAPVVKQSPEVDQILIDQFKDDEILLQIIKGVYTSEEDKQFLLEVRRYIEEHSNHISTFDLVKHCTVARLYHWDDLHKFILDRMAFQFAFLCVEPNYDRRFLQLSWLTNTEKKGASFSTDSTFMNRAYINPITNESELSPAIMAESLHFAQSYFMDVNNLNQDDVFDSNNTIAFHEVPEHLQENLFKSFQGASNGRLNPITVGGYCTKAHDIASEIANRLVGNLQRWLNADQIQVEDLPQCIRAYGIIFSFVDPLEISSRDKKVIRNLCCAMEECLSICRLNLDNPHEKFIFASFQKERRLSEIRHVLSEDRHVLKKYDFDFKKIELFVEKVNEFNTMFQTQLEAEVKSDKTDRVIASCQITFQQAESIYKEISDKSIHPLKEVEGAWRDKVVSQILSIDSPKKLVEEANKVLVNGRYCPI